MSEDRPEINNQLGQESARDRARVGDDKTKYGSPAFGRKVVDGELVIDPHEQEIIELIRRHHKSGKSLQQIANWLNEKNYQTKRGQQWRRISVKRVLDRLYGR